MLPFILGILVAMIPGSIAFINLTNKIKKEREKGEKLPEDFMVKGLIFTTTEFTGVVYVLVIGSMLISKSAREIFFLIPLYLGILSFVVNFGRLMCLDRTLNLYKEDRTLFSKLMIVNTIFEQNLVYFLVISVILIASYMPYSVELNPAIPPEYYLDKVLLIGTFLLIISAMAQGFITRNILVNSSNLKEKYSQNIIKIFAIHSLSIIALIYIFYELSPIIQ